MRFLILGGTGLVGGHLLTRCISAGHEVTVVSRSAEKVREPARVMVADISRPGFAVAAGIDPSAFDVVIHLAYAITGDQTYDRAVTVGSVVEMVHHFTGAQLKHFIYIGSMSVFGIELPPGLLDETAAKVPDNDYAANKIDACRAVADSDVSFPVSILHPTGVWDMDSNRLKSYRKILANGYILLNAGGEGINNIIHADDCAAAILGCVERRQGGRAEEYIINGEAITYIAWFTILEQSMGVADLPRLPPVIRVLCRGPANRAFCALGLRPPILLPAYKRAMFERGTTLLADKAMAHFGWQPQHCFAEIIQDKSESC